MRKRTPLPIVGAEEALRTAARELADSATQFSDEQVILEKSNNAEAIHDVEEAIRYMQEAIAYYRGCMKAYRK